MTRRFKVEWRVLPPSNLSSTLLLPPSALHLKPLLGSKESLEDDIDASINGRELVQKAINTINKRSELRIQWILEVNDSIVQIGIFNNDGAQIMFKKSNDVQFLDFVDENSTLGDLVESIEDLNISSSKSLKNKDPNYKKFLLILRMDPKLQIINILKLFDPSDKSNTKIKDNFLKLKRLLVTDHVLYELFLTTNAFNQLIEYSTTSNPNFSMSEFNNCLIDLLTGLIIYIGTLNHISQNTSIQIWLVSLLDTKHDSNFLTKVCKILFPLLNELEYAKIFVHEMRCNGLFEKVSRLIIKAKNEFKPEDSQNELDLATMSLRLLNKCMISENSRYFEEMSQIIENECVALSIRDLFKLKKGEDFKENAKFFDQIIAYANNEINLDDLYPEIRENLGLVEIPTKSSTQKNTLTTLTRESSVKFNSNDMTNYIMNSRNIDANKVFLELLKPDTSLNLQILDYDFSSIDLKLRSLDYKKSKEPAKDSNTSSLSMSSGPPPPPPGMSSGPPPPPPGISSGPPPPPPGISSGPPPPPPGMSSGPPPPPPGMSSGSIKINLKNSPKQKPIHNLHLKHCPFTMKTPSGHTITTVWTHLSPKVHPELNLSFNEELLKESFTNNMNDKSVDNDRRNSVNLQFGQQKISLLDGKRAQNISIALSKMPSIESLCDILEKLAYEELTSDQIILLSSGIIPTSEEIESIRNYLKDNPGSINKLGKAELFVHGLGQMNNLNLNIEVIQFLSTFDDSFCHAISTLYSFFRSIQFIYPQNDELLSSDDNEDNLPQINFIKFILLLCKMLNYLNGTPFENGITFKFFEKILYIKDRTAEKKNIIWHAINQASQKIDLSVIDGCQDLTHISHMCKLDWNDFLKEIQQMRKSCEKYLNMLPELTSTIENSQKNSIKSKIVDITLSVASLIVLSQILDQKFYETKLFYGISLHDAKSMTPSEFFGQFDLLIQEFIVTLRKFTEENAKINQRLKNRKMRGVTIMDQNKNSHQQIDNSTNTKSNNNPSSDEMPNNFETTTKSISDTSDESTNSKMTLSLGSEKESEKMLTDFLKHSKIRQNQPLNQESSNEMVNKSFMSQKIINNPRSNGPSLAAANVLQRLHNKTLNVVRDGDSTISSTVSNASAALRGRRRELMRTHKKKTRVFD